MAIRSTADLDPHTTEEWEALRRAGCRLVDQGFALRCIVGSAGTVNLGAIDHRDAYFQCKRAAFPPECERMLGVDPSQTAAIYNLGNPIQ